MDKKHAILQRYKYQKKAFGKPKLSEIAEKCQCSKNYVTKVLKEKVTEDEVEKEKEIRRMFFEEHMAIKHIASLENLNEKTIRYILDCEHEKFIKEKENRKIDNAKRAKANRRKSNYQEDDKIMVLLLHQQQTNVAEMSTQRKVSNTQLYANNIQHYHVHRTKSGTYYAKLNDNLKDIAATDIPKSISLNLSYCEHKTYSEK